MLSLRTNHLPSKKNIYLALKLRMKITKLGKALNPNLVIVSKSFTTSARKYVNPAKMNMKLI